jgi:cyclin B
MSSQDKLTETIRAKLIDWLIQIHYNFKLLPETLFLTVNIIDRYFSKHQVSLREVQLVTVAAMLIAAKYEEIYPPLLKDFVYISDNNCSADQILEMEKKILFTIDFDLQLTSPYRFLERFSKLAKIDSVTFYLSQYMLELGLLDSKMNQFPSSL